MQALLQYAEGASGVSKYESEELDRCPVPLAEVLGVARIEKISRAFYDRVYNDDQWFRSIFASSTKQEAIENQVDFLVERLGGAKRYTARKGKHHRLIGRHAPYDLNTKSAARWIQHMDAAMDTAGVDQTSKAILMKYFRHMSYFLVAGRSYTNCTHLIGELGA
eukprot:TRINITY_DN2399_c0_g1_i2.p2 TRINITY_DN2399_c0_g1~~TRINITY_DN2399_c0_g1_i2.p2  ORF type:complete len:164 (+),score=3.92 TRINITY_DN2399_c0_g1_i2:106-597(+)